MLRILKVLGILAKVVAPFLGFLLGRKKSEEKLKDEIIKQKDAQAEIAINSSDERTDDKLHSGRF